MLKGRLPDGRRSVVAVLRLSLGWSGPARRRLLRHCVLPCVGPPTISSPMARFRTGAERRSPPHPRSRGGAGSVSGAVAP